MSASLEEYRQRLREALQQIQFMETELEDLTATRTEPIAVIGAGCRFPGGANSPEEYYRLLVNGFDAIGEVPPERWGRALISSSSGSGAERAARWGAFLNDIDAFDAQFFGISPREARLLDPQQRILLEVAWEALERAGQPPDRLTGSPTGVFIGLSTNDYMSLGSQRDPNEFELYDITGNGHCFPAGRLSYVFGFQGPCLAVDTACSSSLVATHLACQSLRLRECDMALVGGAQLMISPMLMAMLTKSQGLSPDGRCKTFDARANGFVRGEGIGVVILKRLSDAQRDGDSIAALIIGSSLNQDGSSAGFTAPNGKAQEQLLQRALADARVTPDAIEYIETHGTGTSLGDPIEAEALKAIFGDARADDSRCMLGALKTNVGHLEAASGIASIIKMLGVFQNSMIPKNLHFRALNPRISFDGTPLTIPTENRAWKRGAKLRRAGVSAFGMSGTNAHVIFEEPPVEAEAAPETSASAYLLPLSAKTPDALLSLVRSYAEWFSKENGANLQDVVYTASMRRTHHEHRLAVVANTREEFEHAFASVLASEAPGIINRTLGNAAQFHKIVFVFPGQGSQWFGMSRQLLAEEPAFRTSIEACDAIIQQEAGFSILDQLRANEAQSRMSEIEVIQPLLFSIGVALAALWRSWGIEPDCVVGHSMGEVAAAHVAGMVSLHDAVKVICLRSRLLKRISGQGMMALVELPMAEAERVIANYESKLGIAASNGPRATVLSGDRDALETVLAALEKRGVFCRRVKVDVASHSPQVDPLHHELLAGLRDLHPTPGNVPMRSTVTLAPLIGTEMAAAYWVDNLRLPVRFSQVTQDLIREGFHSFIEMSPHPILLPAIEENLKALGTAGAAIASMRRQTGERQTMLEALGSLYMRGCPIDWGKHHSRRGRVVALPTYRWQRERFWIGAAQKKSTRLRTDGHPLLGNSFITSTQPNIRFWKLDLSLEDVPYLADHRVSGQILFPGAAYIEIALAAAREHLGDHAFIIEALSFVAPLILEEEHAIQAEVSLAPLEGGAWAFRYSTVTHTEGTTNAMAQTWTLHAEGKLRLANPDNESADYASLSQARERCQEHVMLDDVLQMEARLGFELGPTFRGLQQAYRAPSEVLARVELHESISSQAESYFIHPALLDGALRGAALALPPASAPRLLARIQRLKFHRRAGKAVWIHANFGANRTSTRPTITLFDDDGKTLVSIEGIEVHVPIELRGSAALRADVFVCQNWKLEELATRERAPGRWLILYDEGGVAEQVRQRLIARGDDVLCVWPRRMANQGQSTRKEVDPNSYDAIRKLISETLQNRVPLVGILYCWGLSSDTQENVSLESLDASMRETCTGALLIAQTLSRMAVRDMPRLWLLSRGAQMVPDKPRRIDVTQSSLWGLGRMIALKYPELKCTRIDLDSDNEPDMTMLVREFTKRENKEEEIALRGSDRYVGRLERIRPSSTSSQWSRMNPNASYLVTGGIGGMGMLGASWLVQGGARHIVLVDKERLTSIHSEVVSELETMGATITVECADVTDPGQVKRVLEKIDANGHSLKGILHCAATSDPGDLSDQNIERLWKSSAPRVLGGWNLHVETQHRALDFLVFFSSLHALVGSPALGGDVLGNVFLDALAHHRQYENQPANSINWGPMGGVGMAQQLDGAASLAHHGMDNLPINDGAALFLRVLRERWVQMGIAALDVRRWLESHPQAAPSPRFRPLSAPQPAGAARTTSEQGQSLIDKLREAPTTTRDELLDNFVREQLAAILRMDPSRIDRLAPIRGLGLDSLMSLELRNRLETGLGIPLSATLVWSHPTIAAMSKHIAELLAIPNIVPTEAEQPTASSDGDTVIDLESSTEDEELFKSFDISLERMHSRRKP